MPKEDDVDFTFDTTGFRNGLKQVAAGIANVSRNTINMAKNVSKGVINAAAKIGLLRLAFRGIQSAIREMPEIGKTFTIAKNIIMKNFLFPVRKAIFPVLQKFLDWVRDNRAMFVKWGQTLVTIFTVVSKAIGNVIDLGKRLLTAFGDFFNRTFGTQIKGFNDLLNIISFKFAVVVQFLSRLLEPLIGIIEPLVKTIATNLGKILEPVGSIANSIIDIASSLLGADKSSGNLLTTFMDMVDFVGDIAKFAAEMVDSFVKGLKPHIMPIAKTIKGIADSFKSIFNSIFGSTEKLEGWKQIFEFIGKVVGTTILATFQEIAEIVKLIENTVKIIEELSKALTGKKVSKEFGETAGDLVQGLFDFFNPAAAAIRKAQTKKVDDAIIKPDGSVIETNPADFIIATKTPGMVAPGVGTINMDFTGMNINVQQATTEEAVRFGENVVDQIRRQFEKELERMGIK